MTEDQRHKEELELEIGMYLQLHERDSRRAVAIHQHRGTALIGSSVGAAAADVCCPLFNLGKGSPLYKDKADFLVLAEGRLHM